MSISPPDSKIKIMGLLDDLGNKGLFFWSELDPGVFSSALGDAWSPADNLRHLTKSTLPVATALRLPRTELEMRFGVSTEPSRPFEQIREEYLELLNNGGTAGRFTPAPVEPSSDLRAWQIEIVTSCADALMALQAALEEWNESDLDRYGLPHPLLGRLSVREMLMFTLYHYEHHQRNVAKRLAALGQEIS